MHYDCVRRLCTGCLQELVDAQQETISILSDALNTIQVLKRQRDTALGVAEVALNLLKVGH